MHRARSIWRYAWASPGTLVGLILALFARMGGATANVVGGVIEVSGGRLGQFVARLPYPFSFRAITFGHVVISVSQVDIAACRAHELAHVRQYERWGVLFFPLYIGSSVFEALCGRDPYWHNHFERQARERAARAAT